MLLSTSPGLSSRRRRLEEKPQPATPPVTKTEPATTPEKPQPPIDEPPPQKPDMKEPAPKAVAFKRYDKSSEEDLRKQLLLVPEVSLDSVPRTSAQLQATAKQMAKGDIAFQGPVALLSQRPDLQGLPLRMGADCQVGKEPAENLQVLSRKMRVVMESTIPKDGVDLRPDADKLRSALLDDQKKEWLRPEAVPCLLQLLQAENSPVRLIMVECLGQIKDTRATQALAMRAMTDLNPAVREAAARELLDRPREDYEPLLLAGLRYPWVPVAFHAAETLAFVKDREALPQLVKLLDQPDATQPFTVRQGAKETPMVREVVRINHLSNCLMCHPASVARTDLVRGAVPTPGQPLPPPSTPSQYYDNGSIFVHADTTYLKQDFSVMQPVPQHDQWPEYQRFDYMVRVRRPLLFELESQKKRDGKRTGSHDAVLFALREISGQDLGGTAQDWKAVVEPKKLMNEDFVKVEDHIGTDWKQFAVSAFTANEAAAEADAQRLKKALLIAPTTEQEKILSQLCDAKGTPYTDALVEAIGHLEGAIQTRARARLVDRLARLGDSELRERLHEDDAETRWAAARAAERRKSTALIPDLLMLLSDHDDAVIQAARSALIVLTKHDFGPQPDATTEQRKRAVEKWNEWWKTETGA
jgi:HEAT repeat protein